MSERAELLASDSRRASNTPTTHASRASERVLVLSLSAVTGYDPGMNWQDHITVDPDVLVGKPIVKGTRLAVDFVLELVSAGWSEADILRNYPRLRREDILACVAYARESIAADTVFATAG